MSFDGNGTYNLPTPAYPAVSGEVIYADDWNEVVEDIAGALSLCLTTDGQSVVTADIPMAGFKFTGLDDGVNPQDGTTVSQVFTNPAFTAPTAVASPNPGDDSLRLATTAWVNDLTLSPLYSAVMSIYAYQNF